MSSWSDGYSVDIEFTNNFNYYLSPSYLNFALLSQGIAPPSQKKPIRFCELACGYGISTNTLAATNPDIEFVGVDFNPKHISSAISLAERAGLTNISFYDLSFRQLLEPGAPDLGKFDYIVFHGVYAWISADNRKAIVEFIDRHLNPGGVVHVSYTAMPGWLARSGLQHFIREHASRNQRRPERQARDAIDLLQGLIDGKSLFFQRHPTIAKIVADHKTHAPGYVVHEYFSDHGQPMYFSQVAREMAEARLDYVGQAALTKNMPEFGVPPALLPMLDDDSDVIWRQTMIDFATNNAHRSDIYVRGRRILTPKQQRDQLKDLTVSLVYRPKSLPESVSSPIGKVQMRPEVMKPIVAALTESSQTIGQLADCLGEVEDAYTVALDFVTIMIGLGYIHPMPDRAVEIGNRGNQLNACLIEDVMNGHKQSVIALAGAASGIDSNPDQILAVAAFMEDPSGTPEALIERTKTLMAERDATLAETLSKAPANASGDELAQRHRKTDIFFRQTLPVLKRVGLASLS